MQSRRMSALETGTNVTVGLVINLGFNLTVFTLAGPHIEHAPALFALGTTLAFFVVSTARQFIIRRIFARHDG